MEQENQYPNLETCTFSKINDRTISNEICAFKELPVTKQKRKRERDHIYDQNQKQELEEYFFGNINNSSVKRLCKNQVENQIKKKF